MFNVQENTHEGHLGKRVDVSKPAFLSGALAFFGLALLISALGVYVGFSYAPLLFATRGTMFLAIVVELVLIFTVHIWSTKYPLGYWMFALFAFISGLTLVPILAMAGSIGGTALIFRALIASTATFVAAALYARVTPRNLMGMGGFLMISLIGLIIMGVIGIFIPWNTQIEIVFSGVAILIFAGFTMYDIQRLSRVPGISPLLAGIRLYLDFINLFISFLRLLMAFGRD
jgi:FtsH-binding integral membrane protein